MPDREKVIKRLEKLRKDLGYGLPDRSNVVVEYLNSLTDAIVLLKGKESVEQTIDEDSEALKMVQEDNPGHWVVLENCSNAGVYCSECSTKIFDHYPMKKKFSYFCPHCGTRMEGQAVKLDA